MSKKKIRRRTKPMDSKRIIIYVMVLAMILCADYLYRNYIEKSDEPTLVEQILSDFGPITSKRSEDATAAVTKPKTESLPPKTASDKINTFRSGWAELPTQTQGGELLYAYHTLSNGLRNYSVGYSSKHHCPVWIAAPMHKCYEGEVKRKDNYTFDPKIAINHQTSLKRSYGDYTRGHMLASADRTITEEANDQLFYVTNIAPQIQKGFNSSNGAWNNIESLVSKQLCTDTLYVVIGCLFDKYTDVDGMEIEPKTTINRNDQKQVSVPTAYYQALLRTRSGKSGRSVMECKAEELKCAAFIVGHRSATGRKPSKREMLTIAELERLTGLEFFANVKNAPKHTAKAEDWGL